jgi:uncharacterized protein YegP (UPF0339 family)
MAKKVKFIIKRNKKGYFYSIEAANGKNLSPGDPQVKKQTVKKAIGSFLIYIQSGAVQVIDETK